MSDDAGLLLSGFADEAAFDKTLDQQFAVMAALGLEFVTLRFVDAGRGVKNVMQLDDEEVAAVRAGLDRYGLRVGMIGSPLGKVRLRAGEDGTENRYVDFGGYLRREVPRACRLAQAFETPLVRGFSFYPPPADDPRLYVGEVAERLGAIADVCDRSGVTYAVEVEANLVGRSAQLLVEILRQANHAALVLVFDGANLVTQGYDTDQVIEQYQLMKPYLGGVHVKDYRPNADGSTAVEAVGSGAGYVDEQSLRGFVPPGAGAAGYRTIFEDLRHTAAGICDRLAVRRVPGLLVDLEPHLAQGGQFGGFSGPDGFGIAARALCELLADCGMPVRLRSWRGHVD